MQIQDIEVHVEPQVQEGRIYLAPVDHHRILWNGGDSTMLHFQVFDGSEWNDMSSKTFMLFPTGTKELHYEMQEFYQECLEEHELNQA